MARPEWFPDWSGDVCAIVAGGESVNQEAVDLLRGRCRVVVINNSHELAPWADLLYAADGRWWQVYQEAKGFDGIKVTTHLDTAKYLRIRCVELLGETDTESDRIVIDDPKGRITRGGNGGFQAVNLVSCFGVRRQIWLGLDFIGEHWHGVHKGGLRNPRQGTLDRWRRILDAQAPVLVGLGIEVVNVSDISTLQAYRKMSLADALTMWRC